MTIEVGRRGLLLGMASLLAAPAIVRASSLMPVKVIPARAPLTATEIYFSQQLLMQRMTTTIAVFGQAVALIKPTGIEILDPSKCRITEQGGLLLNYDQPH